MCTSSSLLLLLLSLYCLLRGGPPDDLPFDESSRSCRTYASCRERRRCKRKAARTTSAAASTPPTMPTMHTLPNGHWLDQEQMQGLQTAASIAIACEAAARPGRSCMQVPAWTPGIQMQSWHVLHPSHASKMHPICRHGKLRLGSCMSCSVVQTVGTWEDLLSEIRACVCVCVMHYIMTELDVLWTGLQYASESRTADRAT